MDRDRFISHFSDCSEVAKMLLAKGKNNKGAVENSAKSE
jgi:hypothetical protein